MQLAGNIFTQMMAVLRIEERSGFHRDALYNPRYCAASRGLTARRCQEPRSGRF